MRTNSTFIVSSAVAYHLETSNIQVVVARDAPTHNANSKLDEITQDCQLALPATKVAANVPPWLINTLGKTKALEDCDWLQRKRKRANRYPATIAELRHCVTQPIGGLI